jgi:hypothetical protein
MKSHGETVTNLKEKILRIIKIINVKEINFKLTKCNGYWHSLHEANEHYIRITSRGVRIGRMPKTTIAFFMDNAESWDLLNAKNEKLLSNLSNEKLSKHINTMLKKYKIIN